MADHLPHTTTPGNPKDHDRAYLPEGIHLPLIPQSAPGSLPPEDSMNCIPEPCPSVNGGRALTQPRSDIRHCVLLGTWPISTAIQVRAGWKRDRGPLFWIPCRAQIQTLERPLSSMRGSGLSSGCLKFLFGDPSFHFLSILRKKAPPSPKPKPKMLTPGGSLSPHTMPVSSHTRITAYFTNEETEARASMWWGLKLNLNGHISCYHQTLVEFK